MHYKHYLAYEATRNESTDRDAVNSKLNKLGFSLGHRTIEAAHAQYSAWLTSHGLDVTRGDLDQQALINDHRATVKKIIALNKKGGKKDLKTVSDLLRELSNDGIYILDVTRLEHCLMLTDQKAKTYAKAKSAKKRNGAKHRATRYAEADADITLQQKFDELLQHIIIDTGFDHDEAEAYLMGMIEDRGGNADGYDLQILEAVEAAII